MKETLFDTLETGYAPVKGLSVKALYRMELWGLMWDHHRLRQRFGENSWWLCHDGEVRGPLRFQEVLQALVSGTTPVGIVHESEVSDENPPWIELRYTPLWSRRLPAFLWSAMFWITPAIILCMLIQAVSPPALRPWSSGAFAMFALGIVVKFHSSKWKYRSWFHRPERSVGPRQESIAQLFQRPKRWSLRLNE